MPQLRERVLKTLAHLLDVDFSLLGADDKILDDDRRAVHSKLIRMLAEDAQAHCLHPGQHVRQRRTAIAAEQLQAAIAHRSGLQVHYQAQVISTAKRRHLLPTTHPDLPTTLPA